ncbi:glycosyltransferase family 4 protein [Bacillus sp. 1P02SD]|uniref:glycosyltransferase family 4 protein n=1 Tax=Bacillus sp. 1P02SD TaxID=3132264 RepID=UPI00399F465B
MKVLVTTHAQMFRTPDGAVWTNSVYGYDFFSRYLNVFEEVRLVTRIKDISFNEVGSRIRVDGHGLEFFSMPFYHGPWEYAYKLRKIYSSISKAIDGCDCAILRIPDQMSFQLFPKIQKLGLPCAVEVVAHPWELYSPGTMKTILRPFLRFLWDIMQKKVCKKADGVSYVTKEYIQQRYPANIDPNKSDRFVTYYTSANLDNCFFHRPREAHSLKKGGVLNITHVSGINNSAKGHFELLQALLLIKKQGKLFKVIFVGGGTMLNYYKDLCEQLGLSEEVSFLGNVSNPRVIASILKESDLFVFPTLTEGLPRVVLEAMSSGLPCIASNVGGIPELLSERCLIAPNDIEGLVRKLLEIFDDKHFLAEESIKNFTRVKQEYRPEIVQEKRRAFYSKLKDKVLNNI